MADVFTKGKAIVVIAAIIGLLLIGLVAVIMKKAIRKKQLKQLAEDKKREEMLDAVLCNGKSPNMQPHNESIPYEVDYIQNGKNAEPSVRDAQSQIMIQLIEHNELSVRKHMLGLKNVIRIGSEAEGNSIVVKGVSPCQCEIFWYEGNAYLRDVGENHITILKRKKKTAYAEQNGIRLQTGDRIILNKVFFEITIIEQ